MLDLPRTRRFSFAPSLFLALSTLLFVHHERASAQARNRTATASAPLMERIQALRAATPNVNESVLLGLEYQLDVADRIERSYANQALGLRTRVTNYLESLSRGVDPYQQAKGLISTRGYRSSISETRQGYSVYLPPNYDPSRKYPLLIMLHGGSSNGNLFLGVTLGHNMDWLTYNQHLWDDYVPRWTPDWIVVAPDGYGQMLWRWMGEQDVLDVADDVARNYSVDADRTVLCGLSNGGVGAYAIGNRHAWRFSMVVAIAGAPSWFQYTGGNPSPAERLAIAPWSGMDLVENSTNTDFRFFHGTVDPGPMRPAYVRQMEEHMRGIGLTPNVTWYEWGHDLLYIVHRHGNVYPRWAQVTRNRHPENVTVVTGDYRANRQHWLTLSRIDNYPQLAKAKANFHDGTLRIQTERVLEMSVDLRDMPGDQSTLTLEVDGHQVYAGLRESLGHRVSLHRGGDANTGDWTLGFLPAHELEKVPGMSGPLTDPYREGMVHVYGTQVEADTAALRQAAERGARGWPLWLWNHQQRVIADTEVTPEIMQRHHLVLYGTPGSNRVLEQVSERLPIRVEAAGIRVGDRLINSDGIGTRFVYPNPLSPRRYLIVQAAPTTQGVTRGHNLPDFLPDYVVYDARTAARRERLIARPRHLAEGYFNRFWRLPTSANPNAVSTSLDMQALPSELEGLSQSDRLAEGDDGPTPVVRAVAPSTRERSTRVGRAQESEARRLIRLEQNRRLGAADDFHLPSIVLRQSPPAILPPGDAPPRPSNPSNFGVPRSDAAGRAARELMHRSLSFLNYRAVIPGGVWQTDDAAQFPVRSEAQCLEALHDAHISYRRPTEEEMATITSPVPSPIILEGTIAGIRFQSTRPNPILISCELASRLPTFAELLNEHNVRAVYVSSSYRQTPFESFHTFGLGMDLPAFVLQDGTTLSVRRHYEETPAALTCEGAEPSSREAATLRTIACEMHRRRIFSSVLTPNYNDGHRDHFHVDARPYDNRFFIR